MEKPHKKLDAWSAAMDLALGVYQVIDGFPKKERYSLTEQMRRAAISIPSNIAEGAARQTKKEFINYLYIAKGSLSELDTQLELARRLGYVHDEAWFRIQGQMQRIDRLLSGLIRHLREKRASP